MEAILQPGTLSGEIRAIPSKSDAHRCLICAALADRPTRFILPSRSADIDATLNCLAQMGASVTYGEGEVTVSPIANTDGSPLLDCGESGSTLRFLVPVAAALFSSVSFTGQGRLPQRPLGELLSCLAQNGTHSDKEALPLTLQGSLQSGIFELPGHISSQYISGLLFALPLLPEGGEIHLTSPLESAGYVDMTIDALRRFGVSVIQRETGYEVRPQAYRSCGEIRIDGDWSNAAFFLAAGAVSGPIVLSGLSADSLQRDKQMLDILKKMGASIRLEADKVYVSPAPLQGMEIDVSHIPDLVPILSVVAAAACGTTRLVGAARLRIKESDRLAAVSSMLRSLGGEIEEGPDYLIIQGTGSLQGGRTDSFNDHRIAMSAAIAASICREETVIEHPRAVDKSYPGFFEDLEALGGRVTFRR